MIVSGTLVKYSMEYLFIFKKEEMVSARYLFYMFICQGTMTANQKSDKRRIEDSVFYLALKLSSPFIMSSWLLYFMFLKLIILWVNDTLCGIVYLKNLSWKLNHTLSISSLYYEFHFNLCYEKIFTLRVTSFVHEWPLTKHI